MILAVKGGRGGGEGRGGGRIEIFSVMSQVESKPDLDWTHSSSVQLIMPGCRQLWQRRGVRPKTIDEDEMKERQMMGKGNPDNGLTHLKKVE